jgi:hypothetical protein
MARASRGGGAGARAHRGGAVIRVIRRRLRRVRGSMPSAVARAECDVLVQLVFRCRPRRACLAARTNLETYRATLPRPQLPPAARSAAGGAGRLIGTLAASRLPRLAPGPRHGEPQRQRWRRGAAAGAAGGRSVGRGRGVGARARQPERGGPGGACGAGRPAGGAAGAGRARDTAVRAARERRGSSAGGRARSRRVALRRAPALTPATAAAAPGTSCWTAAAR